MQGHLLPHRVCKLELVDQAALVGEMLDAVGQMFFHATTSTATRSVRHRSSRAGVVVVVQMGHHRLSQVGRFLLLAWRLAHTPSDHALREEVAQPPHVQGLGTASMWRP